MTQKTKYTGKKCGRVWCLMQLSTIFQLSQVKVIQHHMYVL